MFFPHSYQFLIPPFISSVKALVLSFVISLLLCDLLHPVLDIFVLECTGSVHIDFTSIPFLFMVFEKEKCLDSFLAVIEKIACEERLISGSF